MSRVGSRTLGVVTGGAMQFGEIAKELGVSVTTVQTDYHNAMRKLRHSPEAFTQVLELAALIRQMRESCQEVEVLR